MNVRGAALIVCACALVLAAGPARAEDRGFYFAVKKTGWGAKSALPTELRDALPSRGFLLLSGGIVSSAERVSAELYPDRSAVSELNYASGPPGTPSLEAKAERTQRLLSDEEAKRVAALAEAVSASSASFMAAEPTADFDVRLILVDDDQVKDVDAFGPPTGALDALASYVRGLIEESKPAVASASAQVERRFRDRREDGGWFRVYVYPEEDPARKRGKPVRWHVTFEPGRTDSEIQCVVDMKPPKTECRAHSE